MSATLFTQVQILDCGGADPYLGEVLIRDNRIETITRDGSALPRDNAIVIDGKGTATLMPGLIESHAHLSIDNTDDLASIGMVPPEETTLIAMRNARFYLDCGITAVSVLRLPSRERTSLFVTRSMRVRSTDRGCWPQARG